jgi:hypothetical protein
MSAAAKCCGDDGGPLTGEEEGGGASGATAPATAGKKWRGAWLRLNVKLHLHVAAAGGTALRTGAEASSGSFGTVMEASDRGFLYGQIAVGCRRPARPIRTRHGPTQAMTGGPMHQQEFIFK